MNRVFTLLALGIPIARNSPSGLTTIDFPNSAAVISYKSLVYSGVISGSCIKLLESLLLL